MEIFFAKTYLPYIPVGMWVLGICVTGLLGFIYLKRISMSCNSVQTENVMDWIQFQMRESANVYVLIKTGCFYCSSPLWETPQTCFLLSSLQSSDLFSHFPDPLCVCCQNYISTALTILGPIVYEFPE